MNKWKNVFRTLLLAKNKTNTVLDYFCPMLSSKYTVKRLINCGEQGCVLAITKNKNKNKCSSSSVTRALKSFISRTMITRQCSNKK